MTRYSTRCFQRVMAAACAFLMGALTSSEALAEEIRIPGMGYSAAMTSRPAGIASSGVSSSEGVYRIGPNDVLEVSVWQNSDLNSTVTVRFDGRISLNLAGEIMASGLTPSELGAEIGERLREFIRSPQVTVTVKEFHSRQVLIIGNVARPGIYPLRGPMKLLELLTAAGVDLKAIDLTGVSIIRATGEVVKADLASLLFRQDIRQNIELRAGDNIFVPDKPISAMTSTNTSSQGNNLGNISAVVEEQTIMVLGEVGKPGVYSFTTADQVDVNLLLLKSGGPAMTTAALKSAKIIRADKIQEPVDLNRLIFSADMSQNMRLYSGDALYIPRSEQMSIYVLGKVSRPGIISGQPSKLDLLQAITLAGVDDFGAVLSDVKIVRGYPNKPKVITANVEALLHQGRLEENIPLAPGDVIYVPESFLSNVIDILPKLLSPVTTSLDFVEDQSGGSSN